jgi:long-chain fatty acid transport protein
MRCRRFLQITLFLMIGFSCKHAFAITDEEIFRNFQFSFVNPGARASGMGNAFVALADDATAAEANPAGLTILTKPEVSFEYRNISYDPDKLNSLNRFPSAGEEFDIISQNDLNSLNRPSFLSFVYPMRAVTFAFSRQEAVQINGRIDELFHFVNVQGEGFIVDAGNRGTDDQRVVNWNFSLARRLAKRLSIGATLRYSHLKWNTAVQNLQIFRLPDRVVVVVVLDK